MTAAPIHDGADTGHRPFPEAERAGTLVHRFLEIAAAHPGRAAVVTPDTRWTYQETADRSARVAAGLAAAGLRPGHRVALLFSHGAEMIAALLGVLRAGLSYVPLDAAYPEQRLAYMASDSGARALVCGRAHLPSAVKLAAGRPLLGYEELVRHDAGDPAVRAAPAGEAYVLYTSGSTGRPKPVAQVHRNVLHHTRVWTDGLGIGPRDRLTLQSAYSWDSAVQDTFAALLNGAALYPVDLKALGVSSLLDWMAAEELTVYHSTLPVFRALARAMEARGIRLPAMRMLALGGDTLHLADLDAYRRTFEPHCRVAGAYGSTECSCALLRVAGPDYRPPTGVFPLGGPVAGTTVTLEGPDGRTVDGAGEGEIVVAGRYLAPGATAPGEPYRTGDLAQRLDDGTLLLIGRRDFQVKISGIRVETGEVESALKELPQIREAVVMPFTDRLGERQLAAHLVAEPGARPLPTELRAALRAVLPDHAVPTAYVLLDELPLTANHKIDRAALPDPSQVGRPLRAAVGGRAADRLERQVTDLWCEVLGIADAGPDDNFFDLGGTSLRVAAVHERLTRGLAPALRMTDLYRAPTVRALTRLIRQATATAATATATATTAAALVGPDSAAGAARGTRRRAARGLRRTPARTPHTSTPPLLGEDRTSAPGGTCD
ncbi:non-ribosomal peptide synthetase [Peterkaempfera bronchialis]|uniref:non-ribosomal peptide synthetase n=1 Tax=Peterkaempfera bronchialis TaxID=2126346 RepID=UPI0013B367F1|nr:non-ribosomal peptide synthetase [Peterkaempfera bronchialis]